MTLSFHMTHRHPTFWTIIFMVGLAACPSSKGGNDLPEGTLDGNGIPPLGATDQKSGLQGNSDGGVNPEMPGDGSNGKEERQSLPEDLWVFVPGGTYPTGSKEDEPCRRPSENPREVTLKRGFRISATEVTQRAFERMMGYNPSRFASCGNACPVENITWHEAVAYCNGLSQKEGLPACYECEGSQKNILCHGKKENSIYACDGYHLPTEVQWEIAYRGNGDSSLTQGSLTECTKASKEADQVAWHRHNAKGGPHAVGQKAPNRIGLFDMAGNVWEWCHDGFSLSFESSAMTDPFVTPDTTHRVVRGGGFESPPAHLRAAFRNASIATKAHVDTGFRCVRNEG